MITLNWLDNQIRLDDLVESILITFKSTKWTGIDWYLGTSWYQLTSAYWITHLIQFEMQRQIGERRSVSTVADDRPREGNRHKVLELDSGQTSEKRSLAPIADTVGRRGTQLYRQQSALSGNTGRRSARNAVALSRQSSVCAHRLLPDRTISFCIGR